MLNINSIVTDTNPIINWENNLDNRMSNIFGTNNINNIIFLEFKSNYSLTEQSINSIFANLQFNDPKTLYIKLKTIIDRFTNIPISQINFNEGYLSTLYTNFTTNTITLLELYNLDNYNSPHECLFVAE